jgi:hypothetical protein
MQKLQKLTQIKAIYQWMYLVMIFKYGKRFRFAPSFNKWSKILTFQSIIFGSNMKHET